MTSKATKCVYPVYIPSPSAGVVHDPLLSDFQEMVTNAADKKFAQAFNFATNFTQAVKLSFDKLPTTNQDLDETVEDNSKVTKPFTHDRLSLAEMGLLGYKTQKDVSTTTTTTRPIPIADPTFLYANV